MPGFKSPCCGTEAAVLCRKCELLTWPALGGLIGGLFFSVQTHWPCPFQPASCTRLLGALVTLQLFSTLNTFSSLYFFQNWSFQCKFGPQQPLPATIITAHSPAWFILSHQISLWADPRERRAQSPASYPGWGFLPQSLVDAVSQF